MVFYMNDVTSGFSLVSWEEAGQRGACKSSEFKTSLGKPWDVN